MKIIITSTVDHDWPKHVVEIQQDNGTVITRGESVTGCAADRASIQVALVRAVDAMEQQLEGVKTFLHGTGLWKA